MKARLVPLLAAVLVGCSAEIGGTPTAALSAPSRPLSLVEADPCALLSEETAAEVGIKDVGAHHPNNLAEPRGCNWLVDNLGKGDTYLVAIDFDEAAGLDDLSSDVDPTPLVVGSREAVQVETYRVCTIAMSVGESSRVDASAVGDDDFDSCRMALRLAKLIEPALPLE